MITNIIKAYLTIILRGRAGYRMLLKTGLGILDFYHSDWLNGARLSAHIPAVTKYGQ